MDKERKLIIAGNWKSNKTVAEGLSLVDDLKRELAAVKEVDIVVAPPFTALESVSKAIIDSNIRLGAQNLSADGYGAFTGEIPAGLLKEFSVGYVILGHSERRQFFGETDATINKKLKAVLAQALVPIVCIGETLAERDGGKLESVLRTQVLGALDGFTNEQLATLVIAYEPVWAIGTGRTATSAQAQETHAFVRSVLRERLGDLADSIRIQYGGSVKPDNAKELLGQPDVDGALVGGASLKLADFAAIVVAAAG